MSDVTFSIHLSEELHDRLVAVKQLRAPDASWTDFFEGVCMELESDSDAVLQSKTAEQIKEYPKLRPWRGPVKDHPLFAKAIELVKQEPVGNRFTLLTFFSEQWDEIPSPRVFGRLFKQEVVTKGLARHIDDDKTFGVAEYERLPDRKPLFG